MFFYIHILAGRPNIGAQDVEERIVVLVLAWLAQIILLSQTAGQAISLM